MSGKGGAPCAKWTPAEDAALVMACRKYGTWAPVAVCLPGRTKAACAARGRSIGVGPSGPGGPKRWTPGEEQSVRDHYHEHGMDWYGWSVCLPGRTEKQIQGKARAMGLERPSRNWTRAEDEELSALLDELSERLHRPKSAIASHMSLMTRGKAGKQWRR